MLEIKTDLLGKFVCFVFFYDEKYILVTKKTVELYVTTSESKDIQCSSVKPVYSMYQ